MVLKFLTEASGSLTSAYLLKALKEAGHMSFASDINAKSVGRFLADDFIKMPEKNDPNLWEKTVSILVDCEINVVIPSLDETLLGWAKRKMELVNRGIHVVISEEGTIQTFQDKWLTYQFFSENGIPTPASSLEQRYPLVKPINGRGSCGVMVTSDLVSMEGMISQELVKGEEYTVDVFCDRNSKPVYILPRKRLGVMNGKSTGGIVANHSEIIKWVNKICKIIPFLGPINMQCFVCSDNSVKFIEVNPRIAGGMALAFAATENWINLIVDNLIYSKEINPKPVQYGMEMKRYYAEVFIPPS